MRSPIVFRRLLLSAAAMTLATLAVSTAAHGQAALIDGDLPDDGDGVAMFTITADATTDEIVDALGENGCDAETIAYTEGGEFVVFVPGAPDFVNEDFAGSFESGQPFITRCSGGAAAGFSTDPVDESDREGNGVLVDVRMAEHDGFDRIVFEFGDDLQGIVLADGVPAYRIEYIDGPAVACGSGMDVATEGDAVLEVTFPGTFSYDPNAGVPTIDQAVFEDDLNVVLEVEQTCSFEAVSAWAIGTTEEAGYRVSELSNPTRLVIDIEVD